MNIVHPIFKCRSVPQNRDSVTLLLHSSLPNFSTACSSDVRLCTIAWSAVGYVIARPVKEMEIQSEHLFAKLHFPCEVTQCYKQCYALLAM